MATEVVDDRSWTDKTWRWYYTEQIGLHVRRALPDATDFLVGANGPKEPREVLLRCFDALHAIDGLVSRLRAVEEE